MRFRKKKSPLESVAGAVKDAAEDARGVVKETTDKVAAGADKAQATVVHKAEDAVSRLKGAVGGGSGRAEGEPGGAIEGVASSAQIRGRAHRVASGVTCFLRRNPLPFAAAVVVAALLMARSLRGDRGDDGDSQ